VGRAGAFPVLDVGGDLLAEEAVEVVAVGRRGVVGRGARVAMGVAGLVVVVVVVGGRVREGGRRVARSV